MLPLTAEQKAVSATRLVDKTTFEHGYFVNLEGNTCFGHKEGETGKIDPIARGWAVIETILELQTTQGVDKTFIITCQPPDEDLVSFAIKAKEASQGKLLKGELVNAFGRHSIGGLTLPIIQALSKYTKTIKLVDRPQWLHNRLVAPGLVDGIEFDFEQFIKIDFTTNGDADEGVEALELLLDIFDSGNAAILIAVFMGSPVVAKLWPGDRFTTFLAGLTGTHKTAFIQLLMCMFGEAYSHEINIVRWGHGATGNSLEHLAAKNGPFVYVVDNYKNYTDKDAGKFQAFNQAVCEGGEKKRMKKDKGLRESDPYECMPVITGENYPGQDGASRARTVMLRWTGCTNMDKLTEAQKHVKDLNKLGQEFCLWLSSDTGLDQLRRIADKFELKRSEYIKTVGDAVNAGRIATNAAIISLIWELLGSFPPMATLAEEVKEVVEEAIATHITHSKAEVADDLDAQRFIDWLSAEIEIGRLIVSGAYYGNGDKPGAILIGHRNGKELLIKPKVFKHELVPLWQKSTNGAKADDRSLLNQLVQRGYLEYNKKEQVFTKLRRMNSPPARALVLNWNKIMDENTGEQSTVTGDLLRQKREA